MRFPTQAPAPTAETKPTDNGDDAGSLTPTKDEAREPATPVTPSHPMQPPSFAPSPYGGVPVPQQFAGHMPVQVK